MSREKSFKNLKKMKKFICILVATITLSFGFYSTIEAASSTIKASTEETYGVIEYNVEHTYINREGWGNFYTISVQNNSDKTIKVWFTAKGCNGENENATIKPYGRAELTIATGDYKAKGWDIKIY